jgi:hypothetical protein
MRFSSICGCFNLSDVVGRADTILGVDYNISPVYRAVSFSTLATDLSCSVTLIDRRIS